MARKLFNVHVRISTDNGVELEKFVVTSDAPDTAVVSAEARYLARDLVSIIEAASAELSFDVKPL